MTAQQKFRQRNPNYAAEKMREYRLSLDYKERERKQQRTYDREQRIGRRGANVRPRVMILGVLVRWRYLPR